MGVLSDIQRLRLAMPRREADFVPWALSFAQTVASDPARYRIDDDAAADLLVFAKAYALAYAETTDDNTRTSGAIAEKNELRRVLTKAIRDHAQWIKAQPHLTIEEKMAVGFVEGGRWR